jgi:cytochrome c oxidase subunit 2
LDVSAHGHVIDGLYDFILYLTGAVFIATGLVLFWFLWRYDAERNAELARFTHGSHTLEVVWSIVPAATLLFIAIYQMDTWAQVKLERPPMLAGADGQVGTADDCAMLEVTGRQFEWRIRYPGPDQVLLTPDDLYVVNDLRLPVDEEVVIALKSDDVLHSFFLPNLRVKQDAVPGMKQYVWFKPVKEGAFDIVCAELCGWGHYKMKGKITIVSQDEFLRWLDGLTREQNLDHFEAEAEEEDQ